MLATMDGGLQLHDFCGRWLHPLSQRVQGQQDAERLRFRPAEAVLQS